MRHMKFWMVGGALGLGLAMSAQAQQTPDSPIPPAPPAAQPEDPTLPDPMNDPQSQPIMGYVTEKDESGNSFSIRTEDGQTHRFMVSGSTLFRSDKGIGGELSGLKVGDRVIVQAGPALDGSQDRTAISVQTEPSSESETPGATPDLSPGSEPEPVVP